MSISNYQANKILTYYFGTREGDASFNLPDATLYLGLANNTISATTTGTQVQAYEPGYGIVGQYGYARVAIDNVSVVTPSWSEASGGFLFNNNAISFGESTASWTTSAPIQYIFIADDLTAGNILYYQVLNPYRTVEANTTVYFGPENLVISMA